MPFVKIGIQTKCLGVPLAEGLRTAARLGGQGVTIDAQHELRPDELSDTGIRHLRKLLSDQGLQVAAVTFPTRQGYAVMDRFEQRIAATRAAMKMAYQLGARTVVAPIGPIPSTDDPMWPMLVEAMLSLGQYGEHIGARFAAQTTGTDSASMLRLLETLPGGTLGVDLHPANLIRFGESPVVAVERLGPSIRHVHACDAVWDPGTGKVEEVPLGRGTADFPALLAQLDGQDYSGWATIVRHGHPIETDIANAVRYLRSLEY
ncbi:MAG: sugar phosphate isomerase/epimerase [Pirellulales bacterium]|nr:sugar phosphate isomerase/epimerase [Pirellulales bacterium]